MEYKYVELLSCSFLQSPLEVVQEHITYRYNLMKQQLARSQMGLSEITSLVRQRPSPSLSLPSLIHAVHHR
jgi:hypothetical protein